MKAFRSWWPELRRPLFAFSRERLSVMGLAVILLLVLAALFGRYVVPYPEDAEGALHIGQRLAAPSWEHPFGTDQVGRDMFSRVVIGTNLALQTAVIVLSLATIIGVSLGAIAGFLGGFVEELIMRITDIFLTVPDMVLAIAIAALLGPGIRNAFIALSLVWWPGYCRLMRGQVLAIREEDYVVAARSMGAPSSWIILKHILPNTATEILVKDFHGRWLGTTVGGSAWIHRTRCAAAYARMGSDDQRVTAFLPNVVVDFHVPGSGNFRVGIGV